MKKSQTIPLTSRTIRPPASIKRGTDSNQRHGERHKAFLGVRRRISTITISTIEISSGDQLTLQIIVTCFIWIPIVPESQLRYTVADNLGF